MFEPELADPNKEINFVDHEKDFESQRDLTTFILVMEVCGLI
jgi:hypothetical protein